MYQVYTHPKYIEYGKKFFEGVNERYTKYLKSAADCRQKALYYFSCSCGVAGSETFEYGELLSHSYHEEWSKNTAYHWHECTVCGEKAESAAHEDSDRDHRCDTCYKILGVCSDENNDNF